MTAGSLGLVEAGAVTPVRTASKVMAHWPSEAREAPVLRLSTTGVFEQALSARIIAQRIEKSRIRTR
jgi:hypothetical protein